MKNKPLESKIWLFLILGAFFFLAMQACSLRPGTSNQVDRDLERLTYPSTQIQIRVNSRIKAIADTLEKKGLAKANELIQAISDYALPGKPSIVAQLTSPGSQLEGLVVAGLYQIPSNGNAALAAKALIDQSRSLYLTEERLRLAERYSYSMQQVLTMASMINRETCGEEEMPRMSAVLHHRLAIGMPLQIDSTILYLLGRDGGKLSKKDLKTPSPYNTYLNKGLPPGPLGAPSLAAIDAVLKPEDNTYLYFYSAGRCKHHFSETYKRHKTVIANEPSKPQSPPQIPLSGRILAAPPLVQKQQEEQNNKKSPDVFELFNIKRGKQASGN